MGGKVYDIHNRNVFEEEMQVAHYPECPVILRRPVVILENARTGSSSEDLLINLLGNGLARICMRRYTYSNDKEFINISIKLHIYKDLTFDKLLEGKDSILDKGLEVLRKQIG